MTLHVAYYITGHGFGHATRSEALLVELLARGIAARATVVTSVPEWLFADLRAWRGAVSFRDKVNDVGFIQRDGINIDFRASAREVAENLRALEARIAEEAAFLAEARVDLVVADIPALAIAAARRAGVPAMAVGSFGWDFIYAEHSARDPIFGEAARRFAELYAGTRRLFRLPYATPMDAFPHREEVPFLVRPARRAPADVRSALGFDGDPRPLVLVSFGGLGPCALDEAALAARDDLLIVVLGLPAERSRGHLRCVPADGLYLPDVVRAADVVVSKTGYGMVSEAIAHRTPFLYVPRADFGESPYLARAIAAHLPNAVTDLAAIEDGSFLAAAADLARAGRTRGRTGAAEARVDGAQVIAARIADEML